MRNASDFVLNPRKLQCPAAGFALPATFPGISQKIHALRDNIPPKNADTRGCA